MLKAGGYCALGGVPGYGGRFGRFEVAKDPAQERDGDGNIDDATEKPDHTAADHLIL